MAAPSSSPAGPSASSSIGSAPTATSTNVASGTSDPAAPSSAPQPFHLWDIGGYAIPPPGTRANGPPVFQLYGAPTPSLSAPRQPSTATPAVRSRPRRPNHKHKPAVNQRTYLEAKSRAGDSALRCETMESRVARSARHLKEEEERRSANIKRAEEKLLAGGEENKILRETIAANAARLQNLENGSALDAGKEGREVIPSPGLSVASCMGGVELDLAQAQLSSHSRLAQARVRYAHVRQEVGMLISRRDEVRAMIAAKEGGAGAAPAAE
ncbi:hypothetical protein BOTBODRAFT_27209 [Botryobasidium botryosum FD-172 SS1]|uniref:Uncharacterized protein n=1 Tax=Botryobasidium botryosum (strain FD-172 SS1) TaxID=930990 RepID=A0A067MYL5_BOTB1|nr:hypothetical protein BOTBODRAFT_27209 [Botryobasidium botryosum FD-172 SS1]